MKRFLQLSLLILLMASCRNVQSSTPTATPSPETAVTTVTAVPTTTGVSTQPPAAPETPAFSGVTFSEVLAGVPGNNNREFIELYNAGQTAVDLNGWSIWYRTRADQEPERILRWDGPSDIPPLGHLLLVRRRAERKKHD